VRPVDAANNSQCDIANARMIEVDAMSGEVVALLEKLEVAIARNGGAMTAPVQRPIERKLAQQKTNRLPAPKRSTGEWGEF